MSSMELVGSKKNEENHIEIVEEIAKRLWRGRKT